MSYADPAGDVSREIARQSTGGGRRQPARDGGAKGDGKKPAKPRRPVADTDPAELKRYATTPGRRQIAAVALKTAAYSFVDIAKILEYDSVRHCKSDIYDALGQMADPDDVKAIRTQLLVMAEKQLKRAVEIASDTTLVDDDDEEHRNYEQLAWHHAAREDMRILGQLAGSFAAIQVAPKSVTDKELDALVLKVVRRSDTEIAEAPLDIFADVGAVDAEVVSE